MTKKDLLYFATSADERNLLALLESNGFFFATRVAQGYGRLVAPAEIANLDDRLLLIFPGKLLDLANVPRDVTEANEPVKRLMKSYRWVGWTRCVDKNNRLERGYIRFEYESGKHANPADHVIKEAFTLTYKYFQTHFQKAADVGFKNWFITAIKSGADLIGA